MHSDVFGSFFGYFPTSLMLPDVVNTSASSPGLSGSTRASLGESSQPFRSNHLLTCSDVLHSFVSFFKTLSMLHGADDASALHPRLPGLTFILPGKSSRPFVFDHLLMRPDVVHSFISHFQLSPSRPGTPDVSA